MTHHHLDNQQRQILAAAADLLDPPKHPNDNNAENGRPPAGAADVATPRMDGDPCE